MSKNLPNLQLIVQEKDTLVAFTGASTSSIVEENSSVPLPLSKTPWSNPVRSDQECGSLAIAPCYSPDGELLCTVSSTEPKATITNTLTNALVQEISCSEISSVEFSPLGTYLITWSRFNVTGSSNIPAGTGNLRVWNVKTGELVTHYSQKSQKKNVIQWSSNEHLCMKKVSNEIHILDGHNISAGIKNKIHCKNVAEYSLAYGTVPSTFAYCDVACFASSVSGNPAQLSLHRIKHSSPSDVTNNNSWFTAGSVTVEGPIVSRSAMFNANEATILWNSPINSVALIYTHSDVDSSGASYYGATGAYLLGSPVPPPAGSSPVPHRITKDLAAQVSLTKAGPIYDLSWSPTGLHFVLVGGTMPSNATLYSMQGEPVYEFGSSHRNTICWSPHGRFFCIAGLGNLQGEIDFYEINVDNKNKIKKLGSASAHCTVQYGYSPDSRYFMTSILSPRMNVDNGVSIYKYNGTPVFSYDCDKSTKKTNGLAYSCMWRPSKAGIFPSRCRSPTVQGENAVPKTVTAAEPYRYEILIYFEEIYCL